MSDDLDDADKSLLKGIAAGREGAQVCFYEPARLLSEEVLAKIDGTLQNRVNLTRATYYRILAADLLPQDVHRALYIDGDVLCTGSLEELFSLDLKGCPVGMCIEHENAQIYTYNRLGYPPQDGYFNGGVVLFDLDLWRRESVPRAMLGYLKENAKKLMIHDQDLFNAVLHGRIFPLDYSYNVMTASLNVFDWLEEEKNNYYARQTQYLLKDKWPALRAAVERPRLVHTTVPVKMWHKECDNPFAPVWRYFCAASPWKKERLTSCVSRLPLKKRLRWRGRRALERLNLLAPAIPGPPKEAYAIAQRVLDEISRQSLG